MGSMFQYVCWLDICSTAQVGTITANRRRILTAQSPPLPRPWSAILGVDWLKTIMRWLQTEGGWILAF